MPHRRSPTLLVPLALAGFAACSSLAGEKAPADPTELRAIVERVDELRETLLGYALTETDEEAMELWRRALRVLGDARERFVRRLAAYGR